VERLIGSRIDRPGRLRRIRGIDCASLNTPCGFADPTLALIARSLDRGGLWVVYGHPHSASENGSQSFSHLRTFLERAAAWARERRLRCVLPRQLLSTRSARVQSATVPADTKFGHTL
jgi:hypothetical protein